MPLKYHSKIKSISDCPPAAAKAVDRVSWRFVYDPVADSSFVPRAERDATREGLCAGWALSMFDTRAQALAFFAGMSKKSKNLKLYLGTHLAKGQLTAQVGISTPSDPKGHFGLHPNNAVSLPGIFLIKEELP